MKVDELRQHKECFKHTVYLKGELYKAKMQILTMSRFDKNGSHNKAIIRAIEWRDKVKAQLEVALNGFTYEYTKLAIQKATRLSKKVNKSDFMNYEPFNKVDSELIPQPSEEFAEETF